MFPNGNIAFQVTPIFTLGNIAPVASAMFPNVNIAQRITAEASLLEVLELVR